MSKKDIVIKKDSIWTDIDKQFKVINVSMRNHKSWITYKQIKNGKEEIEKEYSCYQEAFIERFRLLTN